ncbi:MAG: four helix bundle protein [Nitrospira sp. CG24E]|nr:MAG: four helix bundle protein [Nitrospira sp. CG24E]
MEQKPKRVSRVETFQDLEAWQVGREIRRRLYLVANKLPEHERYNLASQIRRAAVSLTANVAEGYGRFHFKENIQYCRIARGSAYELIDHLIACQDEAYLEKSEAESLHQELLTFLRLLNGYIRSIGQVGNRQDGQ